MDKTEITIDAYDNCAAAFEKEFMALALYRESLDCFSDLIEPGSRVLDLGCGPGNVSKLLSDRIPSLDLTGIDLSRSMITLAEKNVPSGKFYVRDIRNPAFDSSSFDAVVAAFCVPFIDDSEAIDLIAGVSGILKTGGAFYISFMEGEGAGFETTSFSGGRKMYINYYSEAFMTNAFRRNNLRVEKRIRQDYPEEDGSVTPEMIFILRKI